MNKKKMWVITCDNIFRNGEVAYLAWQEPVYDEDGYFWTHDGMMRSCIDKNISTPEHPFVFPSRNSAIRKLKKLNIPQKCRIVKWSEQTNRTFLADIRERIYENWNHYKYEDYNGCPSCGGKIMMRGSVSEYQRFVCLSCGREFVLNAINEEIEFKN